MTRKFPEKQYKRIHYRILDLLRYTRTTTDDWQIMYHEVNGRRLYVGFRPLNEISKDVLNSRHPKIRSILYTLKGFSHRKTNLDI